MVRRVFLGIFYLSFAVSLEGGKKEDFIRYVKDHPEEFHSKRLSEKDVHNPEGCYDIRFFHRDKKDASIYDLSLSNLKILHFAPYDVEKLSAQRNKIQDLSSFRSLPHPDRLLRVYLSDNMITDISPVKVLSNLEILYLDKNQIRDLSPLSALKKLKVLNITGNPIQDLSPIHHLQEGLELYIEDCPVENFCLDDFIGAKILDLSADMTWKNTGKLDPNFTMKNLERFASYSSKERYIQLPRKCPRLKSFSLLTNYAPFDLHSCHFPSLIYLDITQSIFGDLDALLPLVHRQKSSDYDTTASVWEEPMTSLDGCPTLSAKYSKCFESNASLHQLQALIEADPCILEYIFHTLFYGARELNSSLLERSLKLLKRVHHVPMAYTLACLYLEKGLLSQEAFQGFLKDICKKALQSLELSPPCLEQLRGYLVEMGQRGHLSQRELQGFSCLMEAQKDLKWREELLSDLEAYAKRIHREPKDLISSLGRILEIGRRLQLQEIYGEEGAQESRGELIQESMAVILTLVGRGVHLLEELPLNLGNLAPLTALLFRDTEKGLCLESHRSSKIRAMELEPSVFHNVWLALVEGKVFAANMEPATAPDLSQLSLKAEPELEPKIPLAQPVLLSEEHLQQHSPAVELKAKEADICSLESLDSESEMTLHEAVETGDLEVVQSLCEELDQGELDTKRVPKGLDKAITAVHYAAYLGQVEIFKYLSKEKGAKGPYIKLLALAKKQAS